MALNINPPAYTAWAWVLTELLARRLVLGLDGVHHLPVVTHEATLGLVLAKYYGPIDEAGNCSSLRSPHLNYNKW
eukprot:305464-Amphidinium_carterae.1